MLRIAIASQNIFLRERTKHKTSGVMTTATVAPAAADTLVEAAPTPVLPSRGLDWDIDQPWVRISSAVAAFIAFVVLVAFFPDHEKSLLLSCPTGQLQCGSHSTQQQMTITSTTTTTTNRGGRQSASEATHPCVSRLVLWLWHTCRHHIVSRQQTAPPKQSKQVSKHH